MSSGDSAAAARDRPSRWPKSKWLVPILAIVVLLSGSLAYAVFAALADSSMSPAGSVPPAPPGWTTVFEDNFPGAAGTAPSAANWSYETGSGSGFGNQEVDHDTRSTHNVFVDGDGHLVIKATLSAGRWLSGRIETTRDDFGAPPGGELEMAASVELPSAVHALGYWPAFWALGSPLRTGSSWPASGEIDMMEDIDGLNAASQGLHDAGGATGHPPIACPISPCRTGYHAYSVIINRADVRAEYLTLLMDGRVTKEITEAEVGATAWHEAIDHGFFIILDLAMGGTYPNSACDCETPTAATTSGASMRVGYVAVYEKAG